MYIPPVWCSSQAYLSKVRRELKPNLPEDKMLSSHAIGAVDVDFGFRVRNRISAQEIESCFGNPEMPNWCVDRVNGVLGITEVLFPTLDSLAYFRIDVSSPGMEWIFFSLKSVHPFQCSLHATRRGPDQNKTK